ncbi:MAG: AAA family ATPase [Tabrizicola sp.]|uniref:AAA family ATPase n=1 Tax=Tabrizicola sp. TaxID=2005166 RepID=UPI0027345DBD|nr:AAA family ATPase [Tabrizicola sp.]MDP3262582.1 AAA family ATPase [Tabrizicola sp.]MDP3647742.1 AAA family ATPase [Paracoccaceae bacterium]MDZ4068889.1 AAA family ATPase [Tabrizicola sp.]
MYLSKVIVSGNGPIEYADISPRFSEEGLPLPIFLVGQNGSGKSIILAHIVNAMASAQSAFFEDSDVDTEKVFKLRSPAYIKKGRSYSTGMVEFTNGAFLSEIQLATKKKDFTGEAPNYPKWHEIGPLDSSHIDSNIDQANAEVRSALASGSYLYYPPNRFEEPAWLNEIALRGRVDYHRKKNFTNTSGRSLVQYSPMKGIQDWLLDLIYNSFTIERQPVNLFLNGSQESKVFYSDRAGPATNILSAVEEVVKNVLRFPRVRVVWSVGMRNSRSIGLSVYEGNDLVKEIGNLFALSTGETAVLNLFLSLIRDYDFSGNAIVDLSELKGLVVVDEIDLHLHADLQHDVLPKLLSLFASVQFVLSTHSPLLLLGARLIFGPERMQVLELPSANEIDTERFTEFGIAFKFIQETGTFEREILRRTSDFVKPVLFVEGSTDLSYIRRAAELLGEEDLLSKFEIEEVNGSPYLDKIWNTYAAQLHRRISQPWILLYDCDTNKQEDEVGNLFKRRIPRQRNKVSTGIENLFSDDTVNRAWAFKNAFFDIIEEHGQASRGQRVVVPETWSVNSAEKRNLCDWLCENGIAADFAHFACIFDLIRSLAPDES